MGVVGAMTFKHSKLLPSYFFALGTSSMGENFVACDEVLSVTLRHKLCRVNKTYMYNKLVTLDC